MRPSLIESAMTTMAAIDRVVHHSVILDLMQMESYRAKEATTKGGMAINGTTTREEVTTQR